MRSPYARFKTPARNIEPYELPQFLYAMRVGQVMVVNYYNPQNMRQRISAEHKKSKNTCKWRTHLLPNGLFIERWA